MVLPYQCDIFYFSGRGSCSRIYYKLSVYGRMAYVVPAIILMVIVVVNIVKDKYIVNKYLSRRKILLSTECIICCITIVYVIFNVIYNSYLLRNGGGQYTEGVYYLINMGERIREITKEDYGRLLLAEYRLFTGHILLLYALEVLFFRIKRMEEG